ncbi:MAG: TatD family hydrolase [Magnetococcales bacterium]|nr:TatD family hydrolase [Magnetococcales bacterium]
MTNHGLIDTHAHLCDERFNTDLNEVIDRASQKGVVGIVLVAETIADARLNLALAQKDSRLHQAAGLYPGYADLDKADEMVGFIRNNRDKLLAIGEVGLDFQIARLQEERDIQLEVLKKFIDLSCELNLPLNIHSRAASKETVDTLIDNGAKNVQLHAYHGKHKIALQAVEADYYFSVPTSIVRSQQMQDLFKKLPLSHLLLESDSPVLGPEVATRNEPCNIAKSIPIIANLKGVSSNKVVEQIYENTVRLYGDNFTS